VPFAEHSSREAEPENPGPDEVQRPLVLLVDDESDSRRLARRAISGLGYGIVAGRDGKQGLELVRRYRPDLVLSDALMPKLDGRDMCRQIKDDPELQNTKVVMTSHYKGVEYETQAYHDYGVDDYLAKPLAFAKLQAVLEKHLGGFVCGTPIALVSLVDAERPGFKARVGLAATETPRD